MMSELTATQRRDLMEIVDDRHDCGSVILATQIPLTSWHQAIGDATYAEAWPARGSTMTKGRFAGSIRTLDFGLERIRSSI